MDGRRFLDTRTGAHSTFGFGEGNAESVYRAPGRHVVEGRVFVEVVGFVFLKNGLQYTELRLLQGHDIGTAGFKLFSVLGVRSVQFEHLNLMAQQVLDKQAVQAFVRFASKHDVRAGQSLGLLDGAFEKLALVVQEGLLVVGCGAETRDADGKGRNCLWKHKKRDDFRFGCAKWNGDLEAQDW